MSKKRKKKENKRHTCPPLTFLDKSTYIVLALIFLTGAILFFHSFEDLRDLIAFRQPETVAYSAHASELFAVPMVLFIELSLFLPLCWCWGSKKPIFGSKKYRYGEYPYEHCVPWLCRKKHRARKTPSEKKFVLLLVGAWCALFLVLASLVPFSLFGRGAIYQDNRIEEINFINRTSDTYTVDDFSHLTLRAFYNGGRYQYNRWQYEVMIEMKDGKLFRFSNEDFDRRDPHAIDICLDKMLEIKSLFDPKAITVKGDQNVNKVAKDLEFNDQQYDKLKALFSK